MSSDFKKEYSSQEIEKMMERANEITSQRSQKAKMIIDYADDGVYLTVFPPQPGETAFSPEDLGTYVKTRRIQDVDLTKVHQAAREMKGEPVYIAPPQKEVIEDGSVRVEVSRDKMEAYLTVYPPVGGNPATMQDVEKALQEKNVVYGIRNDIIEMALKLLEVSEPFTVAGGSEPEDGIDARIDLQTGSSALRGKPTEMVNGRVDFYNLNLIQNVEEGDMIAVKTLATPGIPGRTVTGEEIPAKPGKDVHWTTGKNVQITDDQTAVIAAARGHVVVAGNKISVSMVYEVGDVDFNTGNIEFNGSVIVKGSIGDGFKVIAEGDVEVRDTIADGIVECTGSLKVKNGVVGRKSRIKAGGDVYTKFIQNATVDSGGNVIVSEAIMHSRVSAKKCVAVGGKGVIVGGLIRAGEEINCKIAGSTLATATELESGINPELRHEHTRLIKEKQVKEQEYDKADKVIKLLRHIRETQGELSEDKIVILERVAGVQSQLAMELIELKDALEKIEFQVQQTERGRIMVQGVLHSGVKVTIGSAYMQTHDDYPFVCLTKVGPDIKVNPYK